MSRSNWRRDLLGDPEDDGRYQAYRTSLHDSLMSFKLVPSAASGEPVRYIPYLQPITIELDEASHQLCLLCHSSQMIVFIQGSGLADLAEALSEKQVKSIHEIEPGEYDRLARANEPMITEIRVEKR